MGELKDNNKSMKKIILGILVIVIIAITTILVINLRNKEEAPKSEDNDSLLLEEEPKNEESDSLLLKDLSLDNFIPIYEDGYGYNIYQNKLITVDELSASDLSNNIIFGIFIFYEEAAIASVGNFEGEPKREDYQSFDEYLKAYEIKCLETGNLYFKEKCYIKGSDETLYNVYESKFIEKVYKRYYGENYNYNAPKYLEDKNNRCELQGDYYFCYENDKKSSGGQYLFISYNEEDFDEYIYVYTKSVYVENKCNEENSVCISHIYTDANKTKKIIEKNLGMDLYDCFEDEKVNNEAIKYKHKFKKNSDGTYYWYSVEPVK